MNMDMLITVESFPKVGETILGKDVEYFVGGKGGNQAVAASRVGAEVTMLGKVGKDSFGGQIIDFLKNDKVNTSQISQEARQSSGLATVFRDSIDNLITVIPGANSSVDVNYVENKADYICNSQVLLTQFEIPIESVIRSLQIAKENGVISIVNPAPFNKEFIEHLDLATYITPNEIEFEMIYGRRFNSDLDLEEGMIDWSINHKTNLIVTRGSKGVSYIEDGDVHIIPAITVDVMDTTGAGDTFNGILAVELSKNRNISEAVKIASIGASLSIRKKGAQEGMPTKEEINQFIC